MSNYGYEIFEKALEKVKQLEEHQKQYLDRELITAKQANFFEKMIKENYISKDKIKEKIEETNSEKLNYSEDEYYLENEVKGYAIDKLKELLEEK